MADNLVTAPNGFDIQAQIPIDRRLQKDTLQDMYDITEATRYVGMQVTVLGGAGAGKTYRWDGTTGSPGTSVGWHEFVPIATETIAGLVKPGTGLNITLDGTLNATGGGGGGTVDDGSYADITVSNAGATWTINNNVVGTAKMGVDVSTAGKNMLTAADIVAQRNLLGLGTLALRDGSWVDGSSVSGNNTGDETLSTINEVLVGDITAHRHDIYAPKASPIFSGEVSLPGTTTINTGTPITPQKFDWLSSISSDIQTQFNGKIPGNLTTATNLDNITVTGDYTPGSGITNNPAGTDKVGSKLFHHYGSANASRQMYYNYSTDKIYTRRKDPGGWRPWVGIVLDSEAAYFQPLLTNPVTGTGTTNYIPKLTGASTIGNSVIYESASKIGIGTTTLTNTLTVVGSSAGTGLSGSDGTGGIRIKAAAGHGASLDVWGTSPYRWGILKFDGNTKTVMMEGIGTSSDLTFNAGDVYFTAGDITITDTNNVPGARLDVRSAYSNSQLMLLLKNSANATLSPSLNDSVIVQQDTSPTLKLFEHSGNRAVALNITGNAAILSTNSTEFKFYSGGTAATTGSTGMGGTEIMRYNNSGDLLVKRDVIAYSSAVSDIKLKENIENLSYGLDTVMNMRAVSYDLKETKERHIGFIAQEIQEIVPEIVKERDHFSESILTVNYQELIPVLVKAIQELKTELNEVRNGIGR